jgi:hypothetical protein
MISLFARPASSSLSRGPRRKQSATAGRQPSRRDQDRRLQLAIDQLENRFALSLPGAFSIGGITEGTFLDAPSGEGLVSDQVTVSITGTKGTVQFFYDNAGTLTAGVPDGNDIAAIQIIGASADFQLTIGANIRTETPVPYGSDGIIQLGEITANTVIRGINTVKGALTDVAVAPLPPLGFTVLGLTSVNIGGDQTATFPSGTLVALTPLTTSGEADGDPVFRTLIGNPSYNASTGLTTLILDADLPGSFAQGAITTAERIEPSFVLTSFEGVNFSKGGGLFVDVVEGRESDNLGIQLSGGLIPEATIGIRESLDADMVLGTTRKARADGRVFIESATAESSISVAPSSGKTAANSRFQLIGGEGEFDADVTFAGLFSGVVNLPAGAGGEFVFNRGVAAQAVLNASYWESVLVSGNFAGTINSTGLDSDGSVALGVNGNITKTARVNSSGSAVIQVARNVAKGATIVADEALSLTVGGSLSGAVQAGGGAITLGSIGPSALPGAFIAAGSLSGATITSGAGGLLLGADRDIVNSRITGSGEIMQIQAGRDVRGVTITGAGGLDDGDPPLPFGTDIVVLAGRNFQGVVHSAAGDVALEAGGSVLKGSALTAGDGTLVDVAGNFSGNVTTDGLIFLVGGNVAQASRITAHSVGFVDDEIDDNSVGAFLDLPEQNFLVGGRFDGVLNVSFFDAVNNVVLTGVGPLALPSTTVIAGGVGKSGRINIDSFVVDEDGVGDPLVFAGNFQGNLRVGSDLPSNLSFTGNVDRITVSGRILSDIDVAGQLKWLNSNSYFLPTIPGQSGNFYGDATAPGTDPVVLPTGTLATGRYLTVVPLLPPGITPFVPDPSGTYTTPSAPQSVTATQPTVGVATINVSFSAPLSDGNVTPILKYQYTTDANAGTPQWRDFDTVTSGPPGPITLTVDSAGGAFTFGNTYQVAVRAVNALGGGTASTTVDVTPEENV